MEAKFFIGYPGNLDHKDSDFLTALTFKGKPYIGAYLQSFSPSLSDIRLLDQKIRSLMNSYPKVSPLIIPQWFVGT